MDVSKLFLSKFLGEDICNLLIYREVLQNNGHVMHQLPDAVHVYLYMFDPLPLNWICGDLDITSVVTKYDYRQSTTNLKL